MFIDYPYLIVIIELMALLAAYSISLYRRYNKLSNRLMEIDALWITVRKMVNLELNRATIKQQQHGNDRRFLEYLAMPFGADPPGSIEVWRELIAKLHVVNRASSASEQNGDGGFAPKSDEELLGEIEMILAEDDARAARQGSGAEPGIPVPDDVLSALNGQSGGDAIYLDEVQESIASLEMQHETIARLVAESKTVYESLHEADNANALSLMQKHNENLEAFLIPLSEQMLLTSKYRNQATALYVKYDAIKQEKTLVEKKHKSLLHSCARLVSRYNTIRQRYEKLYEEVAARSGLQGAPTD